MGHYKDNIEGVYYLHVRVYAKCGRIHKAQNLDHKMHDTNTIS